MRSLKLSLIRDDEVVASTSFDTRHVNQEDTVAVQVNVDDLNEYGLDPAHHEWETENGDTVWVAFRNVPYPEYCEECGVNINDSHRPVEARGEVWDRRVHDGDPIVRPMYNFCCEACKDQFLSSTMRTRYNDAPPTLEVQIVHRDFSRFADVLVNGVSVYTQQANDQSIFEHEVGDLPVVNLRLPLSSYTLVSKVMGP